MHLPAAAWHEGAGAGRQRRRQTAGIGIRRLPSRPCRVAFSSRVDLGEGAQQEGELAPRRGPGRELLLVAIDRIHQDHALDAMHGAAMGQRIGGRHIAAAIGDDDHAGGVEMRTGALVAVESHQPLGGLVDIGREMSGLPEIAGARVGRVIGELRRDQCHVLAGVGDLARNRLARLHVALERGALAVKVEHDEARQLRIIAGRQVQQRTAVAVGGILPADIALERRVPAPLAVLRIEERLRAAGNGAAIGEGRRVEGDELRLRLFQGSSPAGGAGALVAAGGGLVGAAFGTGFRAAAFDAGFGTGFRFVIRACAAVGIRKSPSSSARRFTRPLAAP